MFPFYKNLPSTYLLLWYTSIIEKRQNETHSLFHALTVRLPNEVFHPTIISPTEYSFPLHILPTPYKMRIRYRFRFFEFRKLFRPNYPNFLRLVLAYFPFPTKFTQLNFSDLKYRNTNFACIYHYDSECRLNIILGQRLHA